jgi:hypothetical protein
MSLRSDRVQTPLALSTELVEKLVAAVKIVNNKDTVRKWLKTAGTSRMESQKVYTQRSVIEEMKLYKDAKDAYPAFRTEYENRP